VIEGLNVRKKHVRPKSRVAQGIIEIEMPIHVSNVCLCDQEGKPVKVKAKVSGSGKKDLVYSVGDKEIVHRKIKQPTAK
jgi:large subunit ribosomal protein L24